jgi:D-serine deaminase-like pyridoxal phosphate-dependent protein
VPFEVGDNACSALREARMSAVLIAPAASSLADIDTPALVVDLERLDRNIARMNAIAARLGVRLRPHVKTAKCTAIARRIFGGIGPVTVSTLREAEYFLADGFTDLRYAVGFAAARTARAAALVRAGARLSVLVEDAATTRSIASAAAREDVCFDVLVEIDADGHRAGLRPDDVRLVDVARAAVEATHLNFVGVLTHAGDSYSCIGPDALRAHAELERAAVVAAAARLAAAGIPCAEVSVGSTPTLSHAEHLDGVSEARAGVYVFGDLVQSNIGSCTLDDIALSVLATVISHKRDTGRVIIDAGGLALSKDHGTARQAIDYGYGQVCAADGTPIEGLRVVDVNQEHGLVAPRDAAATAAMFDALPIGTRLRVLPNHACMTAAAYDAYWVDGGAALRQWPRCNGW